MSHMFRVGGSQTDDGSTTSINYIYSDNHGVLLVSWNVNSIKVLAQLGVDLLQNVGVNGQFSSINSGSKDELGGNLFLVKESFNCFLVLRVINNGDAKLVVAKGEPVAVFYISDTITLSA